MVWTEAEKIIGYEFKDISLLETAFTHSSYANDFLGDPRKGNERLEFLGDAILDAIVGKELFDRFPYESEGFLTKLRAEIVCEQSLGEAAIAYGLNEFLRLGNGEEGKGGRIRVSMAADAVEAVIAAVFLDGGYDAAAEFVLRLLGDTIDSAKQGELPGDYKTELQILCQKNGHADIQYKIIGETGPDHEKSFTAAVFIGGKQMGTGEGRSKKLAQADAAKQALKKLEEELEV